MKARFYILLLVCLSTWQLAVGQELRNSIVLGINASQIDGDQIAGYTKPGAIAGLASRFQVNEKLGFQPEVLYMHKGSRSTSTDSVYVRWKLSYIQIPATITYEFFPKFTAQAGPAFAYNLSAKSNAGGGYENRQQEFNKLDFLFVGGFEYAIFDNLSVNARLEYSLAPINHVTPSFYNNTIAISLRFYL